VSNSQRNKGARNEREAIRVIDDLLGVTTYRLRTPGQDADRGDLGGLPDTTIEIKSSANLTQALAGIYQCVDAQARNRHTHGVTLIRRPGGRWIAAMTVEQWATLWREATEP